MTYVFEPAHQPSIAVAGSPGRIPVRRIFCVGRNYAAHAREMSKDPDREKPFFFTKPADAVSRFCRHLDHGWIRTTTSLGSVVRRPHRSLVVSP